MDDGADERRRGARSPRPAPHPGSARENAEAVTIAVDKESTTSTLHEEAHKLVDQLPEEASWDDLMYEIYVRQKIEAGRRDIAEGRVVSHEEAKRQMAKWLAK